MGVDRLDARERGIIGMSTTFCGVQVFYLKF